MSDSQQETTQPEEVKEPQQAGDGQVGSANDEVVEPTEKQTEESKDTQAKLEAEEVVDQQTAVGEQVDERAQDSEEKVADDSKALNGEQQNVEQAEEAKEHPAEEAKETPAESPVEDEEKSAAEAEKVVETNGATTEQQPPQVDETNGVGKRKAENGADVAEEENSPKKAKVVNEGDQTAQAVEERAA